MLMSWYMVGYHSGYYLGMQHGIVQQQNLIDFKMQQMRAAQEQAKDVNCMQPEDAATSAAAPLLHSQQSNQQQSSPNVLTNRNNSTREGTTSTQSTSTSDMVQVMHQNVVSSGDSTHRFQTINPSLSN